MFASAVISFSLATVLCLYVAVGTAFGVFHPNYSPELGETLMGFYATLFFGVAVPLPTVVGVAALAQRTIWGRKD